MRSMKFVRSNEAVDPFRIELPLLRYWSYVNQLYDDGRVETGMRSIDGGGYIKKEDKRMYIFKE